jgi:hypothetical protein
MAPIKNNIFNSFAVQERNDFDTQLRTADSHKDFLGLPAIPAPI